MTLTDEGKVNLLRQLLGNTYAGIEIRLAKSLAPVAEHLLTFATIAECDFGGYAPIVPTGWPDPTLNIAGEAESDDTTLLWTASGVTGSQDVWGLYITFLGHGYTQYVLAAHRFASPVTIAADGETVAKNLNAYLANLVP
jgi:hypothetical protein